MKDNNFFNNLFDSSNNGSMEGSTPPPVAATLPEGDMGEFADSKPATSIERKDEAISSDFEEKDYDSSDEPIGEVETPKTPKATKASKEDEGMETAKPVEFSFSPIVSGWVEEGLFSEEDITNAEVDDSADGIKKLITYSADKFKNVGKQEAFEELPEYLKDMINLHKEGVDVRELRNIEENENDFDAIKEALPEDEQLQEDIYMDFLITSGTSPEKAERLLKMAKDTNTLFDYAETSADYLAKVQEKEKEKFIHSQKESAKIKEAEDKKRFEEFTKDILSTKEIKGFALNGEKEAQELLDYMTKPIDKKTGKTQEMIDWENMETRKAFALLNKRKFDFKSLEKKIETKKTIELKKKVENSGDKGLSNKGTRIEAEPPKRGGQIGGLEMYL